jgi:hypothetical protein
MRIPNISQMPGLGSPRRPGRMAGELALIGVMGGAGAMNADAAAHSPMDRVAQDYKGFKEAFDSAPPAVQSAYAQLFGAAPMSNMDRLVAGGILDGSIAPGTGEGPVQADTEDGAVAIEMAEQIRRQAPELGQALGALVGQEMSLFAKEAIMRSQGQDVSSQDVVAAAQQGAGVSPVPALLGGLGVGGGTALLTSVLNKRGRPDPFQVPRGKR